MAKYTITLDSVLKSGFDVGLSPKDYDIFSEAYRFTLNTKLLEHYRFNEIGTETVDRFKFYLNRSMREIMLYYNKLYETEFLKISPLLNYQKLTTGTKRVDNDNVQTLQNTLNSQGLNTTNSSGTNLSNNESDDKLTVFDNTLTNSFDVKSDTPQSGITGIDLKNNVYASEANKNDTLIEHKISNLGNKKDKLSTTLSTTENSSNNSNATTNTTNNSFSDIIETFNLKEEGFTTSQTELLVKFRESLLNIDMMIINDESIRNCFMLIY
jgi:hypothetical protein